MESLYLAGEPRTNSEASLIVGFERNPEIYKIEDEDQPDYSLKVKFSWANAIVQVQFN